MERKKNNTRMRSDKEIKMLIAVTLIMKNDNKTNDNRNKQIKGSKENKIKERKLRKERIKKKTRKEKKIFFYKFQVADLVLENYNLK